MDFIPEKSEIQIDKLEVRNDQTLKDMIKSLKVQKMVPSMNRKNKRAD